ncbi:MAG: hypothetical protein IKZ86_02395 [Spirochaetaceae bacterium]|nr:hypothetical protein [Spirochaetaceae bacterium]
MRESFVIHAEYIEDLPEELKGAFLRYIYEYGINSTEPELSGLELTVWLKIKRRIDDDVEAYERKIANLKQNKNRTATGTKTATTTDNRTDTERTPNGHRTGNTTEEEKPNGDRTDSVSVNDSVNVSVNDIECVSVAETPAEPAPEPAPTKKRFVAPTLEEIREFCFEKNININVDKFFYYYESKGWKVGVTPMKDWKAAVRNWAKNDTLYQQRPGSVRISSDIELLKNYTPPQTQTDVMANLAEIKGESTNAEEDTIIF